MDRNLEANDSKGNNNNESADFTSLSQAFSVEDQQAVFKRSSQSTSKEVTDLSFDTTDGATNVKRMDFPHNWYENSKKSSYSLPGEAAVAGGVEHNLRQGWSKLNK